MKWKYKGNRYVETGKIAAALEAYNQALGSCVGEKQEGIILLLRSAAYLEQAKSHKQILQSAVEDWSLPDSDDVRSLILGSTSAAAEGSAFAVSVLQRLVLDARRHQLELKRIQFRHGLYQYALLRATQDALRATELLPNYSASWLRAGELLGELWKLKKSRQYYQKAISIDENLRERLEPVLEGLTKRQEMLDRARANRDWSEDSLRLALDVIA